MRNEGRNKQGGEHFVTEKLSWLKFKIFMFVCKIYINADTVTVRNYNTEQPQLLLSLRTFFIMNSCLSSCVRITADESRVD